MIHFCTVTNKTLMTALISPVDTDDDNDIHTST